MTHPKARPDYINHQTYCMVPYDFNALLDNADVLPVMILINHDIYHWPSLQASNCTTGTVYFGCV